MHMGGISIFFPDEYLDSAYEIDFEDYYQKGMRGVIFDIDNTLDRLAEFYFPAIRSMSVTQITRSATNVQQGGGIN